MQELDEDGGAAQLAAGSTFLLCRTRKGRIRLIGRQPGAPAFLAAPDGAQLTSCAAGHAHAIFTDGSRVWSVGRCCLPAGCRRSASLLCYTRKGRIRLIGRQSGAPASRELDLDGAQLTSCAAGHMPPGTNVMLACLLPAATMRHLQRYVANSDADEQPGHDAVSSV